MTKEQRAWDNAGRHIALAEQKLSAVKHEMAGLDFWWAHCCRSDLRGAINELQLAIEAMAQVEALGWKD